jgi:hypothetical protein
MPQNWQERRTQPGNADWFPFCDEHPSARVFDADRETSVIDYEANYIEPGVGGTRQALASLSLNFHSSTLPGEFRRDRFCTSSRFLRGLEKRHNLTMRKPHAERRPTIDTDYVTYFRERMNILPEDYPPELVLNMDERCWHVKKLREKFWKRNGRKQ